MNEQLLMHQPLFHQIRWFRVLDSFILVIFFFTFILNIDEAIPKYFEKVTSVDTGLPLADTDPLRTIEYSLSLGKNIRYSLHPKARKTRKRSCWGPRIVPTIYSIG